MTTDHAARSILIPRVTVDRYNAASAIDGADMEGRSITVTWLGIQLEFGVTRRPRTPDIIA